MGASRPVPTSRFHARIDTAAATRAVRGGESLKSYAARTGFSVAGVRQALIRAGIRVSRPRSATDPRLYSLWRSIRSRCERKADRGYARFGALGVRVCKPWQAFPAFQEWALGSGWKPGKALVLRVRSRGYSPINCTWGTKQEAAQAGLTAFGETKSVSAWARDRRARVNAQTIRDRVRDGVDPEEAITAKQVRHGKRGKTRAYKHIDWKRVEKLRALLATEIARRLGNSSTAILRGMKDRGWLERPIPIGQLPHGKRLYSVWDNTLRRQRATAWPDFAAFHAWALRSGYAPGLFLTRPDRAKPASPKNATWLPVRESWQLRWPKTVSRKARRKARAFGETKGVAEWARDPRCVVTKAGLAGRLARGVPPAKAITSPKRREADYSSSQELAAWGITKPVAAWARDRRATVNEGSIRKRLRAGWTPEAAISTAVYGRPR